MTHPADSPLTRLAAEFRADLLRLDADAARRMTVAYTEAARAIETALDRLMQQIAAAQAAGETVNADWLRRAGRLTALQQQIEDRITLFGLVASGQVASAQQSAVALAQEAAPATIQAALGPSPPGIRPALARLSDEALQAFVGTLGDGSPVRDLLLSIGPQTADAAGAVLTNGGAQGLSPRAVARQLRDVLGVSLTRALTISRTETLRAYRSANLASYQRNSDVVKEWTWSAQLSPRTCAVCWAMHGRVFPLSEPFASHPNCRCVPTPRTKSWAELGYTGIPDTRPQTTLGVEVFDALPEEDQRAILGPGKLAAYQAGDLKLADLVGRYDDPRWGTVRYEKSLKEIS